MFAQRGFNRAATPEDLQGAGLFWWTCSTKLQHLRRDSERCDIIHGPLYVVSHAPELETGMITADWLFSLHAAEFFVAHVKKKKILGAPVCQGSGQNVD